MSDNGWPELLPFMFRCLESGDFRLQECVFFYFSAVGTVYRGDVGSVYWGLHGVFLECLMNSPSSDCSLSAVINFIQCLSSSDRDRFLDLLLVMMI